MSNIILKFNSIDDSWKNTYLIANLDKKKEMIKALINDRKEEIDNLKKEINNLKTEQTIKIIIKNNVINDIDNLKKSIKFIKLKNHFEELKVNIELEKLKKLNIKEQNIINNEYNKKIKNYEKENELLIDEEKRKKENELIKYKEDKYNNYQNNKDENYYSKNLFEYKMDKDELIKNKIKKINREKIQLDVYRQYSIQKIRNIKNEFDIEINNKNEELNNLKKREIERLKRNKMTKIKSSRSINNIQVFFGTNRRTFSFED